jgi:Ca2+-binding EF-hand superfamily protein
MKRLTMLAAVLALAAMPLLAQDIPTDEPEQPPPRRERGREGRGQRMSPEQREMGRLLREHDKNQDSALDKDELGDAELLKKLDKDENGSLNMEELMADQKAVTTAIGKKVKAQWEEEFKILDKDDSGKLTKEELGETHAKLLEGDKDDDKELSKEEFLAAREKAATDARNRGFQRPSWDDVLKENDKNKDGKLSKEEAPENMQRYFDRVDSDSDGFLSKEEYEAMGRRGRGDRRRGGDRAPEGEKPAEKPSEKPAEKPADKPQEKKEPKEEDF